jgi:predicted enzyme related to lactoylglutathione lyase
MSTPENNLRLDYVEFATSDLAATKKFLTAAFGWKFTDYGPDYASFADGRITGGLYAAPDAPRKMNPMIVIFAVNLEDAEARVTRAGGKIVKPAFEFPGGRRFQFTEPAGLELSVWSDVRADGSKVA